jgi:hypothetical protein
LSVNQPWLFFKYKNRRQAGFAIGSLNACSVCATGKATNFSIQINAASSKEYGVF